METHYFKKQICLLIALLALLAGSKKCFSQSVCIDFFTQEYSGGNQPRSITSADFNHDGHIDLATANFENNTVSILFGNGDGTFDAPVNYPCDLHPNDIATADFNEDGNADLVTANQYLANSVTVLLGNADGTFSDSTNYSAGLYVDAVTVADVNNDSIPDLVTANEGSSDISCLIGNGDGTFQPAINSPAPGGVISVAVADFNNDGFKDVVYSHLLGFTETIHYFCIQFGDGTGAFHNEIRIDSGRYSIDAIGADINNDGFADVVTADFFDDTASVYFGNGAGTFVPPIGYNAYIQPDAVLLADMNNDSVLELLVADYGSNGIAVLPGHSDGTFGNYVEAGAVVNPQSLTVGDFNEDGLPDVATSSTYFGDAYYAIILNCTSTGIEDPSESFFEIYPNPVSHQSTLHIDLVNFYPSEETILLLRDILGRAIYASSFNPNESFELDLGKVKILPGFYILELNDSAGDRKIIEVLIVE